MALNKFLFSRISPGIYHLTNTNIEPEYKNHGIVMIRINRINKKVDIQFYDPVDNRWTHSNTTIENNTTPSQYAVTYALMKEARIISTRMLL